MRILLSTILLVLLPFVGTDAVAQNLSIELSTPNDGATVKQRQYVKGSVSDPGAVVIVVVHPTETSDFWIQPPVTVKNSGAWKVKAHFGQVGKDQGAEFEVRAFANPAGSINEGRMGNWPIAEVQSDVIDVTRN